MRSTRSSATATTIRMDVPPRKLAVIGSMSMLPETMLGRTLIAARKNEPASVRRTSTRSRNSAVALPGRMPGTNAPYSFMFFAISAGWNISCTQKNEKKKIMAT